MAVEGVECRREGESGWVVRVDGFWIVGFKYFLSDGKSEAQARDVAMRLQEVFAHRRSPNAAD